MKKVLFITGELYPSTAANERILFRVIDQLLTYPDITISILGQAQLSARWADSYKGSPIIHAPWKQVVKYREWNIRLRKMKWLRFLLYPRSISYRIARARGYDNPYVWEAQQWLKRHCEEYDAIVAMSMPYENLDIATCVGDRVPVILYPLEPIATYDKRAADFELKLDYEIALENRATKLILTHMIHKDFLSERTAVNEAKVVEAEFPCVFQRDQPLQKSKKSEKIRIAYVGKFHVGTREPDFMCHLIDSLPADHYLLFVVGGFYETNYKPEFMKKYLSNQHPAIKNVGFVGPEEADRYMMQADILVHIGNTMPNIMPSKILDYISSGKPILNICKIHDCPTIPLIERYPMGLTIFEPSAIGYQLTDVSGQQVAISDEIIEKVDAFCRSNKGKQIPFEEIREMYRKYTPEEVGTVFYQTIQAAINEFKK